MNQHLYGNCLEVLKTLAAKSVHCCVTSPPYFLLRNYGLIPIHWPEVTYCPLPGMPEIQVVVPEWTGDLGMEPNPAMFVGHMVAIFREVHRVLRDDGTLFLNFGDSYWSRPNGTVGATSLQGGQDHLKEYRNTNGTRKNLKKVGGIKHKDMLGMPWRVAFALQADGWYLRQDIIWDKKNPMPESCKDRCTKSHEYVFLLSKKPQYYFDQAAISEECSPNTHARLSQDVEKQIGSARAHGGARHNGNAKAMLPGHRKLGSRENGSKSNQSFLESVCLSVDRRNKRSVWTVGTQAVKDAHFATFPEALIEPMILAGCPEGGTVLDPFGGSGTTGQVAARNRRNYILIDLNKEYIKMQHKRVNGTQIKAF